MASLENELIRFGYDHFPTLLSEEMDDNRTEIVHNIVGLLQEPNHRVCGFYPKRGQGMTTWGLIGAVWLCAKIEEHEPDYIDIGVRFISQLSISQCKWMLGNKIPDHVIRGWFDDGRLQFLNGNDRKLKKYISPMDQTDLLTLEKHTTLIDFIDCPLYHKDVEFSIFQAYHKDMEFSIFQVGMPLNLWEPKSEYFKQPR